MTTSGRLPLMLCLLCSPSLSAVELTGVEPSLVSTAGGQVVTFVGRGFTALLDIRIDGVALTNKVFVDAQHMRGTTPALVAGVYTADVVGLRGVIVASLDRAVEAALPPNVTSVDPDHVSRAGDTAVTVNGRRFRSVTAIRFGSHPLVNPRVNPDGTQVTGIAPALDPGEADRAYNVIAEDSRGKDVLADGVTYFGPLPTITSVDPGLVSTGGGTLVTFTGKNFTAPDLPYIDGKPLTARVLVDSTHLQGVTPSLAAGLHEAQIARAGVAVVIVARLADAVEAAPPITLKGITPSSACAEGGTAVTIVGTNFRAETRVQIGRLDLVDPVVSKDGRSIRGEAPELDPDETLGAYNVTAGDSRGSSTLPGVLNYVECPDRAPPCPQEFETSLAEGVARFRWANPIAYQKILVLDAGGNVLRELPGDATMLELPARDRRVGIQLRGITPNGRPTRNCDGVATTHDCTRPPSIVGRRDPDFGLTVASVEFPLYGGHVEANTSRCVGGGGGGGLDLGGGGSLNGYPQEQGTIGYVVQNRFKLELVDTNKVTTGFVLDNDADRLEIGLFYQKIATDSGLELRGRLVHVYPADGFSDEFTFPDVNINQGYEINSLIYYRADKDVGFIGDPNSPDPAKQPPQPCNLKIPSGEYLLDIYAIGGNPKLPFYIALDDPTLQEILIQGVPCPPYPAVTVRDMTGLRTLPVIVSIEALARPKLKCSPGGFQVTLKAKGSWFDENNVQHQVPADSTDDVNYDFEYQWTIYDQGGAPHYTNSHNSSEVTTCVCDWGCYKVDLVVLDKACGVSRKGSFEVAVVPRNISCASPYYTFQYPTPEPGGIYAIVGLDPPPGQGTFDGKRPVEFRILVVPKCYCEGDDDPGTCPAAFPDDIEFRLFRSPNHPLAGAKFVIEDLCPDTETGAKYFHVTIKDLGAVPEQDFLDSYEFRNVHLQGHAKRYDNQPVTDNDWQSIGNSLKLANYPTALDGGPQAQGIVWQGSFLEEDASYHFMAKSSPATTTTSSLGDTPAVPILGVTEIPAYPGNKTTSGFVSRFYMHHGKWFPETGDGTMDGNVLGNQTKGAPLRVKGSESSISGLGSGGGGVDFPTYEWCDHEVIFQNHFSQTLFEAILYTGTIGPVPVTIWASVGLGLDFMVESQLAAFAAPFAAVDGLINGTSGQHFAQTHFYLCAAVEIMVPCEVRADILGGIANLAVRLVPTAGLNLETDVSIVDTTPGSQGSQFHVKADFGLAMEVQACINLLLGELCSPTISIPIVDPPVTLLEEGNTIDILRCASQEDEAICEGIPAGGLGGGVIEFPPVYQSSTDPIWLFSPDDKRWIIAIIDETGRATVELGTSPNGSYTSLYDAPNLSSPILDPAGAWVSNNNAIVAWTRIFPDQAGVSFPLPQDVNNPDQYLPPRNKVAAQTEIVISPANPLFQSPIRISDEDSVPLADRRADGRAAIAGDLASEEAIVAWVRYESPDFMIVDPAEPSRTIPEPCPKNQICTCPTQGTCYRNRTYVNYRPNMEETAIYARRVNFSGGIGDKKKLSAPGIDIEPAIAISPSGNVAYCLWVHDPTHTDMIESNTGRFLKYSVYSKATDSWGPPQDVLAVPDDYPALLEPYMALKADATGLAAFTAIQKGSSTRDSGLGGGSRYVYVCHLENGVFGEPILIHGKCQKPENGHWAKLVYDVPEAIDPLSHLHIRLPDWVIIYQGDGPTGLRTGAGDVMASVLGQGMKEFTAPVSLTRDENVHSNVAGSMSGGVLHTIHLNGGSAKLPQAGLGGGASMPAFETMDTKVAPDPAVVGCKLSFQFPAPGSMVTATVDVENVGLAGTPFDAGGLSAVGLRAVFVAEDGTERVAGTAIVPEIQPGEKKPVPVQLEMPLDPVLLRVELNPSPLDADLGNNWRVCFFGAPRPKDFVCVTGTLQDEDRRPVSFLSWTNAAVYDQLVISRDGASLVSLPGTVDRFVDLYVAPGPHKYSIRGRILASKSSPAECVLAPPGGLFARADANADGREDISDAVYTLAYLFLGGPAPPCESAADSNDDGAVNISDPSYTLNYLFLGGLPPPAPVTCGVDPTPDALTCAASPGCP